ncbi:hypothetical protein LTR95_015294 [Oleoguttula sp. CCFEE 5521]
MAASIFLKKRGISSAIYELRDDSFTSGGNIALAPNALRVLDHADVFEKIERMGFNYENIAFTSADGSLLGHFLNGSQTKYNFAAIRIHRTIVRDALRAQVREHGIPTTYNTKCVEIVSEPAPSTKVTAVFQNGERVTADFVIGADGIHSTVRSHVAPESATPNYSGMVGIMGYVTSGELSGVERTLELPAMLFGDTGSFAIMPSSYDGTEVGYFASIELEDRSRAEWSTLGQDKQGLRKILAERFMPPHRYPELVQALVEMTPLETLSLWPFFSAPTLDSWVSKSARVILIGDSAHAIPPTGGQGAAMALEDAETLSYALAMIYGARSVSKPEHGEDVDVNRILAQWNDHRHARVAKVLDFTSKNGKLRKSSPHLFEHIAKEWLMWAAFKWMGPEGGAQWMYEYAAEAVRSVLH